MSQASIQALIDSQVPIAWQNGLSGVAFQEILTDLNEAIFGPSPNYYFNVQFYGAVGDGVHDDSGAFQDAVDEAGLVGGRVYIPPTGPVYLIGGGIVSTGPRYLLKSTVTISAPVTITGAGRGTTLIESASTGHAFLVNTGTTGVAINGFTLLRSGTPIAGQDGIHLTGHIEEAELWSLWVDGFWNNYWLCATGYALAWDLIANNAYNDGIRVTNEDGVANGLQWTLNTLLCQQSNSYGLHYVSVGASGDAPLGPLTNWWSYANTAGGLYYDGVSTCPIQGVRIGGVCFSGSEGGDSVKLNLFSTTDAAIAGVYTEANGLSDTGVNSGTAPSGAGRGFYFTSNNTQVCLHNCQAEVHSWAGVESAAARLLMTGNSLRECGQASFAGEEAGILITAGNATVTGNSSKANVYGIYLFNDDHIVIGNDFTENTSAPLAAAVALVVTTVSGNKGVSWLAYTPAITTNAGSLTSVGATGRYQRNGATIDFEIVVTITTNGTGAGVLFATLPVNSNSTAAVAGIRVNDATALAGYIPPASNSISIFTYTGGYPGADSTVLTIAGAYEAE